MERVYEKTARLVRERREMDEERLRTAYEVVSEIKEVIMAFKTRGARIPQEIWDILTEEQKKKISEQMESGLNESEKRQALACVNFTQRLIFELLNY